MRRVAVEEEVCLECEKRMGLVERVETGVRSVSLVSLSLVHRQSAPEMIIPIS